MTVPLHMVEIESEGWSSNSAAATAVVGTTQYFRLKDKRGYAIIGYFIYIYSLTTMSRSLNLPDHDYAYHFDLDFPFPSTPAIAQRLILT